MRPWLDDGDVRLYNGDCVEVMRAMPDASVDAVVCDPPYGLEFMGREWDGADGFRRSLNAADVGRDDPFGRASRTSPEYRAGALFQEWCEAWASEALRVLKPGGHLVAFGGTRTYHRLACAIEDAGFEVRDCLCWLYGSGFPKSLDVSKAIDKSAGAERAVVGASPHSASRSAPSWQAADEPPHGMVGNSEGKRFITDPATAAAAAWEGWGTALKPAYEPIILARKPLTGTVAANVQQHGTGALNIDACRVGREDGDRTEYGRDKHLAHANVTASLGRFAEVTPYEPHGAGRWPANVVLDEAAAAQLDEQSGELTSGARTGHRTQPKTRNTFGKFDLRAEPPSTGDAGGASRFFYTAKASRSERGDANTHPTVKPVALMRWLCRLVTPRGGLILDPFCGSGTTPLAARLEGFRCIAIDREEDYLGIAARRTAQLSLLADAGGAT